MRRFALSLLAVTVAVTIGMAEPASAHADTRDNTAVVINTKDGASRSKLAFSLLRVREEEDAVTATNLAVAYARCESCKTVAIAFQIVLVAGSPEAIVPVNRAIAVNDHCSHCDTLAVAYQFVIVTSHRARLTPQGHRRLMATRRELGKLARSELPIQDIQARAAQLAEQVQSILTSELVVARSHKASCRSEGSARPRCADR